MARRKIDKAALASLIRDLKELSNEQKADLLQLLNEQKRYGLVWEEHKEEAQEVLSENIPVLVEDKSKAIIAFDDCRAKISEPTLTPNHILIEGDNLHALTALTYTHEGKVDVIYIDPPYNTGNKDFVYNDSFVDSEDGYRHSKWLSFMEKRLRIAKKLLSDRGVIFISIDDNEQANLKLLCDEVFGWDCFIGNVSWQRTYSIRNDSKGIPAEVEYILIYSKSDTWQPNKLPRTAEMNASYSNPDGDVCDWMSGSPVAPGASTHQGMVYAIQHPFTGELFYPSKRACWRYEQSQMLDYMNGWCEYKLEDIHDEAERANICGISSSEVKKGVKAILLANSLECSQKKAQEVYAKGPWPRFYFTNKGKGGVRRKVYLDNVGGRIATNYWPYDETGHTDEAKKELIKIFGDAPFDTPKPSRLLNRILMLGSHKDSAILDFFAGSGTTLHATMQLNAEDGGHRKCVLVTNNENGICENVTYERNKRVINGYTTPKGVEVAGLKDNNLRFYRTEFVPRDLSTTGQKNLMLASTDLLCVKNDLYEEKDMFGDIKLRKHIARYFDDGTQKMLIIYKIEAIESLVEEMAKMPEDIKIKVYVFSTNNYAMDEDFEEVADKVDLYAMPAALWNAYKKVLPRKKNNINEEEDNA